MQYVFDDFLFTIDGFEGVAPTAYQNRLPASSLADDHHIEESHLSSSLTSHSHKNHHVVVGYSASGTNCDGDETSMGFLSITVLSLMSFSVQDPFFCIGRRPVFDGLTPNDLGAMNVRCPFCDALHWENECVSSSRVGHPEFQMCCAHGKVNLTPLRLPPAPLYDLFVGDTHEAKQFRSNIVQYNAALAFTSLGVKIDHSINSRGPPVFRIHGELRHLSGSLLPQESHRPSYSQLYIYDPHEAFQQRVFRNENLSLNTMRVLQGVIHDHNPYASIYQHAFEVLQIYDAPDYTVKLCVVPGHDPRRYNLPTADEVGVILPEGYNFQGDSRDIILHLRPQTFFSSSDNQNHLRLECISEGHAAYAPLHYILFFPYGEPGWYYEFHVAGNHRRVTLLQYSAFRLHSRPDEFSTILRGCRLFQTYLVDMFACIDQERLHFIQTQQPKLRTTLLNGIEDALSVNDDNVDLNELGQRIILPSSYLGGPRDMYQRYLDGMAIARHFKKINIFMMMTANPNWPEIRRELFPGQSVIDRPDLVSRVFELKKKAAMHAILKKEIFGPCVAHVYSIEFQKRGLPHMHLLLFLKTEYKLISPEAIDCIISAQWPDPITHPILFDKVKKFMVHGPCGILNPNAPCMENGKCIHGYPKPFQEHTTMDHDGYPHYARPNNGRSHDVRGFMLDNRWIVPYNPFSTLHFECHINVECAICFGSMKYLNKYIKKGGDCGTLTVHDDHDEVKQYIDGRYISASEAAWRIFQFHMHGMYLSHQKKKKKLSPSFSGQEPNVVRLPIHLPHEQRIVFDPSANAQHVVQSQENIDTPLTAFFKTNQISGSIGDLARTLTYQEFPNHFVLKSTENNHQSKTWNQRQRNSFAIGRMMYIGPTAGERFYLRTLLMVTKGPKSFDDLKSVNDEICESFQDACLRRGLLEDDNEWEICLHDASEIKTGCQLRNLFTTLLLFCAPAQPHRLWLQFRDQICDDLHHNLSRLGRRNVSQNHIYDFGLHLIDNLLHDSGHSLSDFPSMPLSLLNWSDTLGNRLISQQLNYDRDHEDFTAQQLLSTLNEDQQHAFRRIWHSISLKKGETFFIDGFGGCGKTYLYQAICHAVRAQNSIILCVASTGLACLLLPGGQTAHSMFKIPIDLLDDTSVCHIPKESFRAELIRMTEAVIFDECLMTHRHCFEALDRTFQDLRNSQKRFGGLTMIFGGDFQQILPVIPKGSRADIVNACLRKSYLWDDIIILKLRKNMRLQSPEDIHFSQWLLDVGHGRNLDNESKIELPHSIVTYDEDDLINKIYDGIEHIEITPPPLDYFLDRAILAPRNIDVETTNEKLLKKMSGQEIICHSADTLEDEGEGVPNDIPQEFLRTLTPSSLPLSELKMKIGCPLILLRNLDPANGLCNGTRMILLHAYRRFLEVIIMGGDHHGQKSFIPRIILKPSTRQYPFLLKRRQFPVRLSFAMSINKAEGQSLKYVGIHLLSSVFCHGQLYVALSRTTSSQKVFILLPDSSTTKTTNIVYPEVLLE